MKKAIFLTISIIIFASCGGAVIKVSNTSDFERIDETVGINWDEIVSKLPGATPGNIIVIAPDGTQQPSQVIYNGGEQAQQLIFQATTAPNGSTSYKIKTGAREEYPALVFGRLVPERKDDFAWENNRIAFRIYGPALEKTGEISNGIDVWVKRTEEMIIDKWYTPGYNYHRDHGEGLDCYKVGRTLGAGAMAPYEQDTLWLGNNFTDYRILDQGPVRITFQLEYAPFSAGSKTVAETRVISFDANTHFNRITEIYSGDFDKLKVAAGIVLRGSRGTVLDIPGEPIQAAGYWEPLNTDNNDDNGHTAVGLVFPGGISVTENQRHLLTVATAEQGKPLTYFMGAGWSNGWVPDAEAWTNELYKQVRKLNEPLTVVWK